MTVGILAVQGAFIEHRKAMEKLGVSCIEIRQKSDLNSIDGLILPGGESTVQGKLMRELGMFDIIQKKINDGLPVLATCAGLILLAQNLENDETKHLATLPVTVKRNAYGRQLGSFVTTSEFGEITDYPMVFIRAPYITQISESACENDLGEVKVLAKVDSKIVGVKYKNQIALAFHPEMTDDLRIHKEFLSMIA